MNADAIVALPGGPGSLDELFEVLTWRQLGLHAKPVYLLNVNGYWDPLLRAPRATSSPRASPTRASSTSSSPDTVPALIKASPRCRTERPQIVCMRCVCDAPCIRVFVQRPETAEFLLGAAQRPPYPPPCPANPTSP